MNYRNAYNDLTNKLKFLFDIDDKFFNAYLTHNPDDEILRKHFCVISGLISAIYADVDSNYVDKSFMGRFDLVSEVKNA